MKITAKKYLIERNKELKKHLAVLKNEISDIDKNLTKIKSSKFYRLWRIYRYIIENGQV